MNWLIMSLSRVLQRIGVSEMGRKSLQDEGRGTFGMGVIEAVFHCEGTVNWLRDKENYNKEILCVRQLFK